MATYNKPSKAKTENTEKAAPPAPVAKTPAKPVKTELPGRLYQPTRDEIQARAFQIYLSEGCKPGTDLENWLRAEKELRARGPR
jgi:biotin carboxyl carrier protein